MKTNGKKDWLQNPQNAVLLFFLDKKIQDHIHQQEHNKSQTLKAFLGIRVPLVESSDLLVEEAFLERDPSKLYTFLSKTDYKEYIDSKKLDALMHSIQRSKNQTSTFHLMDFLNETLEHQRSLILQRRLEKSLQSGSQQAIDYYSAYIEKDVNPKELKRVDTVYVNVPAKGNYFTLSDLDNVEKSISSTTNTKKPDELTTYSRLPAKETSEDSEPGFFTKLLNRKTHNSPTPTLRKLDPYQFKWVESQCNQLVLKATIIKNQRGAAQLESDVEFKALEEVYTTLYGQLKIHGKHSLREDFHQQISTYEAKLKANNLLEQPEEYSGIGVQADYDAETGKFKIVKIFHNSPAALAKLKEGDIIMGVKQGDQEHVFQSENVMDAVQKIRLAPGVGLELVVERDGEKSIVKIDSCRHMNAKLGMAQDYEWMCQQQFSKALDSKASHVEKLNQTNTLKEKGRI